MRECCLDSAAGVVEYTHSRRKLLRQPQRGARQIQLDHLGRTGADQEQQADVRTPRDQLRDDSIEFIIGVGEPGEIFFFHDRRRKPWLGKDHNAGGGLDQMRTGARSHHEEEGILDLTMQPDDTGQAAEHFTLAVLTSDRFGRDLRADRTSM